MTDNRDEYGRDLMDEFYGMSPAEEARWRAVAAELSDFDGSLITESLEKGWTVAETIAQGREDLAERDEEARAFKDDYEFQLDHDMSMNA